VPDRAIGVGSGKTLRVNDGAQGGVGLGCSMGR